MKTSPVSEDFCSRLDAAIDVWLGSLERDESGEQDVTVFQTYLDRLREVLEAIAKGAAPRDEWEPFWSGSSVVLRSAKLSHDFTLDVDDLRNRLCLSSSLAHSQHLPKMTDEFWGDVLALHEHADVTFTSNRLDSEAKSIAWAIMQDYVELAAAEDVVSGNRFLDIGRLELAWSLAKGTKAVCAGIAGGFRRLYHLNYLLYRHEYIVSYSRQKSR